MKRRIFTILFILISIHAGGQNMDVLQIDKLTSALQQAKDDTTRALVMTQLAEAYRDRDRIRDSTLYFAQKALELSRQIEFPKGESKALLSLSYYFFVKGNLTNALELGLKGLELAEKHHLYYDQAFAMIRIGNVYMNLKDYRRALQYYEQTRQLTLNSKDSFFYAVTFWRAADAYLKLNMVDSALYLGKLAEDTARGMGNSFIQSGISATLAIAYASKGNDTLALQYFHRNKGVYSHLNLAGFYRERGNIDSAIYYAELAYASAHRNSIKEVELQASTLLSSLFEPVDAGASLKYLKVAMAARDSLYGAEKIAAATSLAFQQRERENELLMTEIAYRNKIKWGATLAGLGLVALLAIILFRNNQKERKANALLQLQKNEIAESLAELRRTQAQLIQKEKMASLGELTAGIAHEIQNPLNFVNNFAELNSELSEELIDAADSGAIDDVKSLAASIRSNEQKIKLHGQRADGIVKNMLEHSRTTGGQKQLTEINKLVDEYVRLASHGYRAKQQNFDIKPLLDLDPFAGALPLVPQDIGRVLLNLLNNAFYTVQEKSAKENGSYQPSIVISTRRNNENGRVYIEVRDNGCGIPEQFRNKIFQPFFTTKPTGQATGLGLSLSYDIMKTHGGDLYLDNEKINGSSFVISLPAS